MPMYEFECKVCKQVIEKLCSMSTTDIQCDSCQRPMDRLMSACYGQVVGGTPKLTTTKLDKNG